MSCVKRSRRALAGPHAPHGTPGVLEALFAFCRGVAGLRWRVWGCREAPARTRSSPSTGLKDAVRVGAVRGLTVQRDAVFTRVAAD